MRDAVACRCADGWLQNQLACKRHFEVERTLSLSFSSTYWRFTTLEKGIAPRVVLESRSFRNHVGRCQGKGRSEEWIRRKFEGANNVVGRGVSLGKSSNTTTRLARRGPGTNSICVCAIGLQIPTFYALIFTSLDAAHVVHAYAAAACYSGLLLVMIILWLWLELTDPAAPGGCACPCFKADRYWNSQACEWQPTGRNGRIAPDFEIKPGTKKTNQLVVRYDAATKKRVKGLDHFCKWLNTPVGFRNYPHFFVLVVLCNVQVIYTFCISITALAAWGASAHIWAWVLWILNACGCGVLIYFGCDLMFYHCYLMRRGISTYDDIFEKAQKRTQARKRARKKATVSTNAAPETSSTSS